MLKKYNGNKFAIILQSLAGSFLCILIAASATAWDLKNARVYYTFMTFGIIYMSVIALTWCNRLCVTIDERQIALHNYKIVGSRSQIKWDEIESICYYPLLCNVVIRPSNGHGLFIDYLINDYKQAWGDIVRQVRESNPKIKISPKLIKKLENENIL